jgi:hypothetical protein
MFYVKLGEYQKNIMGKTLANPLMKKLLTKNAIDPLLYKGKIIKKLPQLSVIYDLAP